MVQIGLKDDMKMLDDLLNRLESNERIYFELLIIRKFEKNLLQLFSSNRLFGTTHTCIGQEAIATGVMASINEGDIVFSNHRCHGHFIAYSHRPELLLKEIMGKELEQDEEFYENFYEYADDYFK